MPLDPAFVALSLAERVGGKRMRALLTHFGSADAVLRADADALQAVYGVGAHTAATIRAVDVDRVAAAMPRWRDAGLRLLTWDDPDYPAVLAQTDDPPPLLFVRGHWDAAWRMIAVVGTRSPSPAAHAAAQGLGVRLAQTGVTVVSGLALGIDAAAHVGALAHPDGWTVGVLGSGVGSIYPPQHEALAQAVVVRGALVSELAPLTPPSPSGLVARNRIIAGLSEALIVVETAVEGGAMHAARRARDAGRAVYTLDLPASGNQALLAEGAHLLDDVSAFAL